ncbi:peptidoglycan-N-acetylglucosamine deacetylase [Clostridium acetireducens DSM 10703]|uniref:Peptidoglycan-N-acetylglucosamine deacetylase n=1 Tax=Clostridium acetireducens DSM 10703 TaxID=1121290 RepID=A0A1E8F034_9CLOT|nr:polysaccharide deacetylase family protein [Clostridium acetireducens]OFI06759.1 peptidoglycan-N-acetylglucosamine deacetylase [Clostridium acetireducens DSM 10703]
MKKGIMFLILLIMIGSFGFFFAHNKAAKSNVLTKAADSKKTEQMESEKKRIQAEKEKKEKEEKSKTKFAPGNVMEEIDALNAKEDTEKVAYLTFDDGPSRNLTPKILDILKENDVKATFFVIGYMAEENKDLLIREKNEGHSIANHTYSHNYKKIYSSPEAFLQDLQKGNDVLKNILGEDYNSKLIRFPGGSFGNRLNPFKEAAKNNGYSFVDWNALNGDAEAPLVSVEKLMQNLRTSTEGQKQVVILMHDAPAKTTTVQALPEAIQYLKSQGYTFKTLN